MSKEKVMELIAKVPTCFMATIEGKAPHVRPMVINVVWEQKIYGSTFLKSRKVGQLKKNALTEIVWMDDKMRHVRISGKASIINDEALRNKYFKQKEASLKEYFSGPTDPNYGLLEIVPEKIEFMDLGAHEYAEVKW